MSGGSALYTERTNGPTREQYAAADRLLRDVMLNSQGNAYFEAAGLLCWIENTRPARRSPLVDALSCRLATAIYAANVVLLAAVLTVYGITR